MSMSLRWVDEALGALEAAGRTRQTCALTPISAIRVVFGGREVTLFGGNDYLGLSHHPAVRKAAAEAAERYGMGPRSAALICGYSDAHAALEDELAALKGTAAALLLPTGYHANLAALSALGGPNTTVYSDALNHASIIDGCRLSRAEVVVYKHADPSDLAEKLAACPTGRRKVIVTDALFSMEGTLAPLHALVELKHRYDALLVTDEAHATLLFGRGGGLVEAYGLCEQVDLQVGTLSKAVGALGGYIACSQQMRRLLINTARTFIFTTALPVPVVEAARAAITVATTDDTLLARLWANVDLVAAALDLELQSPIVPIVFGDPRAAVLASRKLLELGLHVPAIRPPTVPEGTSRLRVTLSAAHTEADIDSLLLALETVRR